MVHSVTPLLGTWVAHLIKNYAAKILIPGSSLTLYTGTPSFCHFRAPAHNVGAPNNIVFLNFVNYCKPEKKVQTNNNYLSQHAVSVVWKKLQKPDVFNDYKLIQFLLCWGIIKNI